MYAEKDASFLVNVNSSLMYILISNFGCQLFRGKNIFLQYLCCKSLEGARKYEQL